MLDEVITKLREMGATIDTDPETGRIIINGEYTAEIILTRCKVTPGGHTRWHVELDPRSGADITVLVRMNPTNETPADFYLLPKIGIAHPVLRLGEHNGAAIDTYRRDSLAFFIGMAARASIEVAA